MPEPRNHPHDDDGGDERLPSLCVEIEPRAVELKVVVGHDTALLKVSELFFRGDLDMWPKARVARKGVCGDNRKYTLTVGTLSGTPYQHCQ
jgi:hypothetical protein